MLATQRCLRHPKVQLLWRSAGGTQPGFVSTANGPRLCQSGAVTVLQTFRVCSNCGLVGMQEILHLLIEQSSRKGLGAAYSDVLSCLVEWQ